MIEIFARCCRGRMSALSAKPCVRHSVSEWSNNNRQLSAIAQHERHISNVIRQEGRSLRNETSCTVGSSFVRTPTRHLNLYRMNDSPFHYTLPTTSFLSPHFILHLFSVDSLGWERYLSQAEWPGLGCCSVEKSIGILRTEGGWRDGSTDSGDLSKNL